MAVSCDTNTGPLHERAIIFTWLKRWFLAWAERRQQREIEWLHEEGCRLKEKVLKITGGERITLSPEQRRLLTEKAQRIDPKVLKQISLLDFQDLRPPPPNDTSTDSP